jgi:hypothetical protein
MEEPIDLNEEKLRIRCKSLALIFDNNIDRNEIYEYYIKILKVNQGKSISLFISWDTIYHSIPNTTILIDFGVITDRTGLNKFKYKKILPVIRKVPCKNFDNVLEDFRNGTGVYPDFNKPLDFSFDAESKIPVDNDKSYITVDFSSTNSIQRPICPRCRNERYGYQLSNDGVICKTCKSIKKKTEPEKELDLKERIEKLELEVEKFRATIGFLHNCLASSMNHMDTTTFMSVYNGASPVESDMGIVFINLGFASTYVSRPVFHLKDKNVSLTDKLLIIIERVSNRNDFEKEMIKRYPSDVFTEMKPFKLEFIPIPDKLLLETSYNNIKRHLDTNKHVDKAIEYDYKLIKYDTIFLIHKDYLSSIMFLF